MYYGEQMRIRGFKSDFLRPLVSWSTKLWPAARPAEVPLAQAYRLREVSPGLHSRRAESDRLPLGDVVEWVWSSQRI